jgi:predicted dehydrogenase
MDRRTFIKTSGLAISSLPFLSSTFQHKPYKIVLVGCGWWGMNILRYAIAHGNSLVSGLCDVDEKMLRSASAEVENLTGNKHNMYKDFRDAISKEKPDIVIIGTPDHWHAIPAIEAITNGAHVYLEKPVAHTIHEGKAILKAARDNKRMVQVGTHRRLSKHNISAMQFLKEGKVGRITQVKTFVNYHQDAGTINPDGVPPEGLDWNFWLGPAPERNYNSRLHPKGFRQYLDFANGQISNWGIHWFDQVLWWTEEKYPKNIFSTGSKLIKRDGSDAPDTQLAVYEFETFSLSWEHKLCAENLNENSQLGCLFYGTEGTLHLGWRDGWTFYPKKKGASQIHEDAELAVPDHQNIKESWADFILSIETGKLPVCDIETGHLATNISLLGMISYKTGRSIKWDGHREMILNDPQANKLLSKEYRGSWALPGG